MGEGRLCPSVGTKGILLVTGQLGPDPRRETVGQVRLWTILALGQSSVKPHQGDNDVVGPQATSSLKVSELS